MKRRALFNWLFAALTAASLLYSATLVLVLFMPGIGCCSIFLINRKNHV